MAIDTAAKRNSALDHEEPWTWGAPLPDGSIDQGDRQHSIWSYSGVLAGAAAVATIEGTWQDVQFLYANRDRIAVSADRGRTEVNADRQRVEVRA